MNLILSAIRNMSLSGPQRKKLQEALIDAFRDKASLEQMLSHELDKNLDEIAFGGNLQNIVFELIKKAEAYGWLEDLIRAACESNPGNARLRNVAQELMQNYLKTPDNSSFRFVLFPRQGNNTPQRINRKQFLKWAGLGGTGLVTAVVSREIFKGQSPTPISTNEPIINKPTTNEPIINKSTTNESTNEPTTISVAAPRYISPTEEGRKALGLPLWTVQFETVTVDEQGQVVKRDPNQQAKFFKEDLGNNVTLEMVEIPAGSFKMGSLPGEKSHDENEGPQHTVNVPTFFLGRFEVTQEQYQQVMGKKLFYFRRAKLPVDSVFWNDAIEFCKKLSQKTGRKYRLPSEAEWEYACRAGTITPFHFGETITTSLANYVGNFTYAAAPKSINPLQATEVGSFPPNAFGLYDMHGNVWEWCADTWHDNYNGAPVDGSAWINNDNQSRLLRGGSWCNSPDICRSACRYRTSPNSKNDAIGFRVICDGVAGRT